MRRQIISALLVSAVFALPAQAQGAGETKDTTAPVIARIESEGFTISDVRRTLLGRTLIISQNRTALREVVLNRFTGEILRDRQFPRATSETTRSTPPAPGSHSAGPASPDVGAGAGAGAGEGGSGGAGAGKN